MKNGGHSFEDDLAAEGKGKKTHSSGARLGENDVMIGAFAAEAKHTRQPSYSLKTDEWRQADHRARIRGQLPSFNIRMASGYRVGFVREVDFTDFLGGDDIYWIDVEANKFGNYIVRSAEWAAWEQEAARVGKRLAVRLTLGGDKLVGITHRSFLEAVEASR